jgi:ribosomal protein L3
MVVQKKTVENDGYDAVKVGFVDVADKKLNKPDKGLFSKIKVSSKKFLNPSLASSFFSSSSRFFRDILLTLWMEENTSLLLM